MHKSNFIMVLASALVTLLSLAPVGYAAYRNMPPRVAIVDLQKLIEEEQARTMEILSKGGSVTSEQRAALETLTMDFAKKLSANIDVLGAECRCVIVNKAALLGGETVDYTDLVRERIKR